ncbi:uncharacterized protein LOC129291618 isoform X3 [Prosopis cineraria]|uniref:uncharacterized protein LOC129291618 isoform X3 n=1 Tax=Prosopis cineraria TaxID=364024 RepID=UPI0024105368|nr:uncharacterized protein LOC129291618 isoform X3 [Prosopis cineraria]
MMITILGRRLLDWLRNGFVWSKTNFFILGLVFSYALVKKAVVDILIDFLTDEGLSLWQAVLVVLLLDWISAVFKVVVTHVSEVYSGRFSVIIFCTAVYAMQVARRRKTSCRLRLKTDFTVEALVKMTSNQNERTKEGKHERRFFLKRSNQQRRIEKRRRASILD